MIVHENKRTLSTRLPPRGGSEGMTKLSETSLIALITVRLFVLSPDKHTHTHRNTHARALRLPARPAPRPHTPVRNHKASVAFQR